MIIRLETVNAASARIVKMYTDEDCVLLRILNRDAVIQRNEDIRGASHDCF